MACTLVSADGTQVRSLVGASGLLFDVTEYEASDLPVVDVGLGATSIQNDAAGSYAAVVSLDIDVVGSNTVNVILWWAAGGDLDPLVQVASTTVAIITGPETISISGVLHPSESGVFFAVFEYTTGDACDATIESTSTFQVCTSSPTVVGTFWQVGWQ